MTARTRLVLLLAAACALVAGCSSLAAAPTPRPDSVPVSSHPGPSTPIRWQHVIVVVEENHGLGQIIGAHDAPYFNQLAHAGADFVQFHAETHPSQPNYVALFSGSTHGLTDDSCPHTLSRDNIGHQLISTGRTFVGYAEGLPQTGSQVCTSGSYARKHTPWTDFADLPSQVNRPLTAFPRTFTALPTLSFVIPDLQHDMHDGTVPQADTWLRAHLGAYARWAPAHHSLLVVTWDEDDDTAVNRIPTIAVGADVTAGRITQRADHYNLLRTLEDANGLTPLGNARHAVAIRTVGLNSDSEGSHGAHGRAAGVTMTRPAHSERRRCVS